MEQLYKSFCAENWNEGFAYGFCAAIGCVLLITILTKLGVFFTDRSHKPDKDETQ